MPQENWEEVNWNFNKDSGQTTPIGQKLTYQQLWERWGITYEESKEWLAIGFRLEKSEQEKIKGWKTNGFTPQEAKTWIEKGLTPKDCKFDFYLKQNNYQLSNLTSEKLTELRNEYNNQDWLNEKYPRQVTKEIKLCNEKIIQGNKLTIIDYPNLETIKIEKQENLTQLYINKCPKLKTLIAKNSHLTNLGLTEVPNLEELDLTNNNLDKQDLSFLGEQRELKILSIGKIDGNDNWWESHSNDNWWRLHNLTDENEFKEHLREHASWDWFAKGKVFARSDVKNHFGNARKVWLTKEIDKFKEESVVKFQAQQDIALISNVHIKLPDKTEWMPLNKTTSWYETIWNVCKWSSEVYKEKDWQIKQSKNLYSLNCLLDDNSSKNKEWKKVINTWKKNSDTKFEIDRNLQDLKVKIVKKLEVADFSEWEEKIDKLREYPTKARLEEEQARVVEETKKREDNEVKLKEIIGLNSNDDLPKDWEKLLTKASLDLERFENKLTRDQNFSSLSVSPKKEAENHRLQGKSEKKQKKPEEIEAEEEKEVVIQKARQRQQDSVASLSGSSSQYYSRVISSPSAVGESSSFFGKEKQSQEPKPLNIDTKSRIKDDCSNSFDSDWNEREENGSPGSNKSPIKAQNISNDLTIQPQAKTQVLANEDQEFQERINAEEDINEKTKKPEKIYLGTHPARFKKEDRFGSSFEKKIVQLEEEKKISSEDYKNRISKLEKENQILQKKIDLLQRTLSRSESDESQLGKPCPASSVEDRNSNFPPEEKTTELVRNERGEEKNVIKTDLQAVQKSPKSSDDKNTIPKRSESDERIGTNSKGKLRAEENMLQSTDVEDKGNLTYTSNDNYSNFSFFADRKKMERKLLDTIKCLRELQQKEQVGGSNGQEQLSEMSQKVEKELAEILDNFPMIIVSDKKDETFLEDYKKIIEDGINDCKAIEAYDSNDFSLEEKKEMVDREVRFQTKIEQVNSFIIVNWKNK